MIIDHIGLAIRDYERSKRFFTQALRTLGIELVMEVEGWAGLGRGGKPELWFGTHTAAQQPMHIAFSAESRDAVRAFYAAALAAGGKDNGPPGVREIYPALYNAKTSCWMTTAANYFRCLDVRSVSWKGDDAHTVLVWRQARLHRLRRTLT